MKIVFATSNPHKLREVSAILSNPTDGEDAVSVVGLDAFDRAPQEPEEDGATFEDNARLKARYYAKELQIECLAEDSGLEVDALEGAPGVYSARFAGTGNSRAERDLANNDLLLRRLRGVPMEQRTARFVCAMCLCRPDGTLVAEARGTFEGLIAETPAGRGGFGYDPLLYVPSAGCTSAELSPEEKNARSHRGQAARGIADLLRVQSHAR